MVTCRDYNQDYVGGGGIHSDDRMAEKENKSSFVQKVRKHTNLLIIRSRAYSCFPS